MADIMNCPMCTVGNLELLVLKSENKGAENKSYMWICDECPAVLLEYSIDADRKAFNKYLSGDKSDVLRDDSSL